MKKRTALIRQVFDEISLPSAYPAKAGAFFVTLELDEQNLLVGNAADYVRDLPLALLGGGFLLFLILFGRQKGVKTVLSPSCYLPCGVWIVFPAGGAGNQSGMAVFIVCGANDRVHPVFGLRFYPQSLLCHSGLPGRIVRRGHFGPRSFPTRCAFPES